MGLPQTRSPLSLSINPFALSLSKGRVSKGRSSKNPTKSIPSCVIPGPSPLTSSPCPRSAASATLPRGGYNNDRSRHICLVEGAKSSAPGECTHVFVARRSGATGWVRFGCDSRKRRSNRKKVFDL